MENPPDDIIAGVSEDDLPAQNPANGFAEEANQLHGRG